ncbi:hypothetical protein J6590_052096 [Homalodisca vitripennis]|nr:hypothetical protein J6590_052096 [Homalodisca vitripennis]
MQDQAEHNRQQQRQPQQQDRKQVCRRLFAEEPWNLSTDGEQDNIINKTYEEINRDLDAACEKIPRQKPRGRRN